MQILLVLQYFSVTIFKEKGEQKWLNQPDNCEAEFKIIAQFLIKWGSVKSL